MKINEIKEGLENANYIPNMDILFAVSGAVNENIPLLIEGAPGTGKTYLAKAVSKMLNIPLIRVQFYEGKEVRALIDGVIYSWDGESVTYDYEGLEYIDPVKDVKILVDGEEKKYGVLGTADSLGIYLEIYGGGTGIFLELAPSEQ